MKTYVLAVLCIEVDDKEHVEKVEQVIDIAVDNINLCDYLERESYEAVKSQRYHVLAFNSDKNPLKTIGDLFKNGY